MFVRGKGAKKKLEMHLKLKGGSGKEIQSMNSSKQCFNLEFWRKRGLKRESANNFVYSTYDTFQLCHFVEIYRGFFFCEKGKRE